MKTYLSAFIGGLLLLLACSSNGAQSGLVFGPFIDFQGELPLNQVGQGVHTSYYHCWSCPPQHAIMCGYASDFIQSDGDPGATGTARVIGVAFDKTTKATRQKPDPDFTVTTIYGLDLSPDGSSLSMGGFNPADPELVFHDEMLLRNDGGSYEAGPAHVLAIKDVPAFLGQGYDLSFLTGSPNAVVFVFQTVFPHSQQWNVFTPFEVTSAVSWQTHGSAGPFDINLPLTGTPGVECRQGATPGNYTIEFFSNMNLSSVASVATTCGTVTSSMVDGTNAHGVIINLDAAACNATNVTLSLDMTNDLGDTLPGAAVTVGLLLGDVDGNGRVTNADVNLTKAAVGQTANGINFRDDVTVNGLIQKSDTNVVKQQLGTSLP